MVIKGIENVALAYFRILKLRIIIDYSKIRDKINTLIRIVEQLYFKLKQADIFELR
jgi:hypothetical protein